MKKTLLISLAIALPTYAAQLLPADCTNPLVTSPVSRDLLEGNVTDQLADLIAAEKTTDPSQRIEQVHRAVARLVNENAITPAQAEHVFGDRVLGTFSPIILKYVVAELKAREYDDENVVDFILNFETAFDPETRVKFAIDVARRMLFTVNDAGAAGKAAGFERYLEFVDAFGVDRATFAAFRQTWGYVREAHASTVVHFILSCIKRTASQFESDAQAELDSAPAAAAPAEDFLGKLGRWLALADATPVGQRLPPTLQQIALENFNGFEVPEFLRDIEVLDPDRPAPPPLLDLFLADAASARVPALLERLEMSPPFAWDLLVRGQLGYLNHADLVSLTEATAFRRFAPELQEAIRVRRELFENLRAVAISLHDHRLEAEQEHGQPNYKAVGRFKERLDRALPRHYLQTEQWVDGFRKAFDATLKLWDLNSADFLEIAKALVADTFEDGNGHRALAMVKILKDSSRRFVFAPGKLERFFESLDVYKIRLSTFEDYGKASLLPAFKKELVPKDWGRLREPNEPDPAAMARADLARLRELLPAAELTWRKDADLEKIFVDWARKKKEASFLNTNAVEKAVGLDARNDGQRSSGVVSVSGLDIYEATEAKPVGKEWEIKL